jgi:CPA1 family monovalent cation:H+ antiporter
VGRHAGCGVAGRRRSRSVDDVVRRPVSRAIASGVPDLRDGGRHAVAARADQLGAVQAQDKAARAAADRLDELLAESQSSDVPERAAEVLRHWNTRRLNSAWERLGRTDEEIGESPTAAFRRLRLEMLAAERKTFIEERDAGRIDDEALRSMLHGLDLEEATLNRK